MKVYVVVTEILFTDPSNYIYSSNDVYIKNIQDDSTYKTFCTSFSCVVMQVKPLNMHHLPNYALHTGVNNSHLILCMMPSSCDHY